MMMKEMDNLAKIIVNLNEENKSLTEELTELREIIKEAKEIIFKYAKHGRGVLTWNKNVERLKIIEKLPQTEKEEDKRKRNGVDHPGFKSHCKNGHPFDGDNLKIDSAGQRKCQICVKRNAKKTRETAMKRRKLNDCSPWDI